MHPYYSGAEFLSSSLKGMQEVSLCARFYTYQFGHDNMWQHYLGYDFPPLLFSAGLKYGAEGNIGAFDVLIPPWKIQEWNTVCYLISHKYRVYQIVMNGEIVGEERTEILNFGKTEENLGLMGWKRMGGFIYSVFGEMADINIGDRVLNPHEVRDWEECRIIGGGNKVDWSTATWVAVGLEEIVIEKEEVCKDLTKHEVIVSDVIRNFPSTDLFCRNIVGGEIMVVKDDDTALKMSALLSSKQRCILEGGLNKNKFFTGYDDIKEEGVFVDVNTGEKMEWNNWGEYEPNNYLDDEDCTVYDIREHAFCSWAH